MYSHCIFCKRPLGSNRALEQFPVGGRLAFDERLGRLWVVCPHCARWNLSPIEERWEVIDECERLFRRSSRRVSTDQIGLAAHPTGLDLVRIGAPARPEMAAWRYGRELLSRRRRHRRSQLVTVGAAMAGWPILLATFGYRAWRKRLPVAHTVGPDGRPVALAGVHAADMRLYVDGDECALEVRTGSRLPAAIVRGDEAIRVTGQLLPWLNRAGSTTDGVERAVRQIERAGSPEELFRLAALRLQERAGALVPGDGLIRRGHPELRLALEMAAHDDLELQAARGELERLERAWREAEEIARIADNLLIPQPVRRALDRLRGVTESTGSTRPAGGGT